MRQIENLLTWVLENKIRTILFIAIAILLVIVIFWALGLSMEALSPVIAAENAIGYTMLNRIALGLMLAIGATFTLIICFGIISAIDDIGRK